MEQISENLLGKTIVEALDIYPDIRVVCESGRYFHGKLDYQHNRLNVETENGTIVKVIGFY